MKSVVNTFLLVFAVSLLAVIGCGGGDGEQAAHDQGSRPGGGGGQHGSGPGGQRPQQPPVPVAVQVASVGAISSYYTATATLAAEKEAQIMARVSGVVEALHCEEGDRVRLGQALLTIDNDEYRYRLEQAEANTADIRSRFERLEEMQKQDLVSAEEYETLKNGLKSGEAEEGLARLTLSYTNVTAPFNGAVVSRLVDVGQNVSLGTPLFVLSDFDPLLARVFVPAKEFKKLKPDQPVELVLESGQQRLNGRIKLVSPVIDPSSGTIKVTIEIPIYPNGVRPGDFAEVRIVTESRTGSTLVPKIALVTDRGEQVVYVATDGSAERRVVDIGFQDDEFAEILSGVLPEEPIVVKGQRSLKHGSPIKILEGGSDDDVADTQSENKKEQKNPPKKRKGS
jgi:membrane fusion protein (multidrug efflux system)